MSTKELLRFDSDIKKFAATMDLSVSIVLKKITVDLFSAIVKKTPVRTGRARASWNINSGHVDLSVALPDKKVDYKSAVSKKIKTFGTPSPMSKVFITNNLEYIVVLEDGSSKQAPHGMTDVSLQEAKLFIRGALL